MAFSNSSIGWRQRDIDGTRCSPTRRMCHIDETFSQWCIAIRQGKHHLSEDRQRRCNQISSFHCRGKHLVCSGSCGSTCKNGCSSWRRSGIERWPTHWKYWIVRRKILFVLPEIHDEMFHVEVEIFKTRSRIKHWMRYRDVTLLEEKRAIQSLERELAYMIDNYVVLSSIPLTISRKKQDITDRRIPL